MSSHGVTVHWSSPTATVVVVDSSKLEIKPDSTVNLQYLPGCSHVLHNLQCIPLLALSGGSVESTDAAQVAEEFQEN